MLDEKGILVFALSNQNWYQEQLLKMAKGISNHIQRTYDAAFIKNASGEDLKIWGKYLGKQE